MAQTQSKVPIEDLVSGIINPTGSAAKSQIDHQTVFDDDPEDPSLLEDVAKSARAGAARGIPSIPGVGGDIEKLFEMFATWANKEFGADFDIDTTETSLPTTQDIVAKLPDAVKEWGDYDPKTDLGRYTKTGTEFGSAALLPIPGTTLYKAPMMGLQRIAKSLAPSAAVGTSAGLLGESAKDVARGMGFDDSAQTAGTWTSLLSAIPLAYATRGKSQAGKIAKEALKDIPTDKIDAARILEKEAKQVGLPLSAAESIDSGNLARIAGDVAANRFSGPTMGRFLSGRPKQTQEAVDTSLAAAGGPVAHPKLVAKEASDTAAEVLKRAREARTVSAQKAGYKAADLQSVSSELIDNVRKNGEAILKTLPEGSPTIQPLQEMLKRISKAVKTKPSPKRFPDLGRRYGPAKIEPRAPSKKAPKRISETNIAKLDSAYKEFRDKIRKTDPVNAMDAQAQNKVGQLVRQLDEVLLTNPTYAKGRARHKLITEKVIDVLDAGDIGALSRAGSSVDSVTKIISSPTSARKESITQLATLLNKVNPKTFPKIARLWMENVFDVKLRVNKGGPDLAAGADIFQAMMGTPLTRTRTLAVLDGVARAQGKDPKQLKMGFEKLMRVFERTGRIPGFGSPTQPRQEFARQAGKGRLTAITDLAITKPLGKVSEWLSDMYRKRAFNKLADVFTHPNSVDKLIDLAKKKPRTAAIQTAAWEVITASREAAELEPTGE